MIIDSTLAVSKITDEIIDYIIDKIVNTVHPSKIILFGSQVRGDHNPESDVDLLVITQTGENREQIRLKIEQTLRGRRFGIDLLVRTPEEVQWNIEMENPFYIEEIFRQGRIKYECAGKE
jgi:uncharacterized protein